MAEDPALWDVVQETMNELMETMMGIIAETYAVYPESPFGIDINVFNDYAMREAAMFGLYYLIRDTIVSLAAFGGAFLWEISPATNFIVAFGCGVLGTAWFAWRGRDLGPSAVSTKG